MVESIILIMFSIISVMTLTMVLVGVFLFKRLNNLKQSVQKQINHLVKLNELRQKSHHQIKQKIYGLDSELKKTNRSLDQCVKQNHLPVNHSLDHRRIVSLIEQGRADIQTIQSIGYSRSEAQLMANLIKAQRLGGTTSENLGA